MKLGWLNPYPGVNVGIYRIPSAALLLQQASLSGLREAFHPGKRK